MLNRLLPPAKTRADRKVGAMLIATGIGIGIGLGTFITEHTAFPVPGPFVGVLLGLAMYSVVMRKRLCR